MKADCGFERRKNTNKIKNTTYGSFIVEPDLFGWKGTLPNNKLVEGCGDVSAVGVTVSCSDHQICIRIAVILRHVAFCVLDAECAVYVDLQAILMGPSE